MRLFWLPNLDVSLNCYPNLGQRELTFSGFGLKLATEVARAIVERETLDGKHEHVSYGVIDPAAFVLISGPSIAETRMRNGAVFRRANNQRVSHDNCIGGWT